MNTFNDLVLPLRYDLALDRKQLLNMVVHLKNSAISTNERSFRRQEYRRGGGGLEGSPTAGDYLTFLTRALMKHLL